VLPYILRHSHWPRHPQQNQGDERPRWSRRDERALWSLSCNQGIRITEPYWCWMSPSRQESGVDELWDIFGGG